MARPVCGRPVTPKDFWSGRASTPKVPYPCGLERMKGKQRCLWHWLADQPAHVQAQYATARYDRQIGVDPELVRPRVPKEEWPLGQRWCAGCQSFVPLFYCSGSRCKSCASTAAHGQRVEKLYGITEDEYNALLRLQGGRCAICKRRPRTKRLAVDHDHATGLVRGLLCANNENGCNRAVIANLEQAVDGGLQAARRAVAYLEDPPYGRLAAGRPWEPLQPKAVAKWVGTDVSILGDPPF